MRKILIKVLAIAIAIAIAAPAIADDNFFWGPEKSESWAIGGKYDHNGATARCGSSLVVESALFALSYTIKLNNKTFDKWSFHVVSEKWKILGEDGFHFPGHVIFHTPTGPKPYPVKFNKIDDTQFAAVGLANEWLELWQSSSKMEFVIKGYLDNYTGWLDLSGTRLAFKKILNCIYENRNRVLEK